MSTEFEETLIAYCQSLWATWGEMLERDRCKRELLRIVDTEFGEDSAFTIALKGIVEKAYIGADAMKPKKKGVTQ